MKTTIIEVPLANNEGKVARFELDHARGDVKVTATGFKAPWIKLDDLRRAFSELQDAQAGTIRIDG